MLEDVTFLFRSNHPSLDTLIEDIAHSKFNDKVHCKHFVCYNEKQELNLLKQLDHDMYVIPDMGFYYKSLLDLKKHNKNLLSYVSHNGVNPYTLAMYVEVFMMKNLPGPSEIYLDFIEELKDDDKETSENET
jgi:hypothetical protein